MKKTAAEYLLARGQELASNMRTQKRILQKLASIQKAADEPAPVVVHGNEKNPATGMTPNQTFGAQQEAKRIDGVGRVLAQRNAAMKAPGVVAVQGGKGPSTAAKNQARQAQIARIMAQRNADMQAPGVVAVNGAPTMIGGGATAAAPAPSAPAPAAPAPAPAPAPSAPASWLGAPMQTTRA